MRTIDRINDIIKIGEVIAAATAASPLILLIGDAPHEAAINLLLDLAIEKASETITKSKTPELAETVKGFKQATRKRVVDEAELHALDHNNEPEYDFWIKTSKLYL